MNICRDLAAQAAPRFANALVERQFRTYPRPPINQFPVGVVQGIFSNRENNALFIVHVTPEEFEIFLGGSNHRNPRRHRAVYHSGNLLPQSHSAFRYHAVLLAKHFHRTLCTALPFRHQFEHNIFRGMMEPIRIFDHIIDNIEHQIVVDCLTPPEECRLLFDFR